MSSIKMRGTTICCIRKNGEVAIGGDGQVTLGDTVVKHGGRKVRTIRDGAILTGFAGSTADAMNLFERFEAKLDEHAGSLMRAAVSLAKEWRTDKYLRQLEAMMIVADRDNTLLISGNGDVLEPDDGVAAIGSGGAYAKAAATALVNHSNLSAKDAMRETMLIAASICIYTNTNITIESIDKEV
ncbi:ATP dependent peptidase CodWX, CodW component [Mariprofundus aestuarium]|uniref:ATP-dependent protease subunit HslV n=1 Tax=Mariprofundus aestuarium TaxID=1921086 RepID=A0A2K8KZR8_MARES|nr:ATP-dependent protease subunit HslV [Mariprofundus aestuarium]ATX79041.1 ATP dependent peptidase CodWX, CodW component [Mariprofundus aestuarium]